MSLKNIYNRIINGIKNIKGTILQNHGDDHFLVKDNPYSNFFFLLGSTLLCFLFSLFAVASLFFLFKRDISQNIFFIGIAVTFVYTAVFSWYLFPKEWWLATITSVFVSSVVIFLCLFFAGKFYDLSWDGQGYHQDGIIMMKEWWNPFYRRLNQNDTPNLWHYKWLTYYPKAGEITESTIYSLTNRIEYSKGINLISSIMVFFLGLAFFSRIRKFNFLEAALFSLLLVINPVSIFQSLSFYIDILVYNFFVTSILCCALTFSSKRTLFLISLGISLIYLANLKTTALFYSAFLTSALGMFVWYHEKVKLFLKIILIAGISLFVAFSIFGANPYLTNFIYYKNPLYPVGTIDQDYVAANAPGGFAGKPTIYIMLASIFAKSDDLRNSNGHATFKVPFTYTQKELNVFAGLDPTTGGFGPLFSGIFILTILLISVIGLTTNEKGNFFYLLGLEAVIFVTVLLNPIASYARLVPQIWLIPVVAVIAAFLGNSKISKTIGLITIVIMFVNCYLIAGKYYIFNTTKSSAMKSELKSIAETASNRPLLVNFDEFPSNRARFKEAGIRFTQITTDLPCNYKIRILKDTDGGVRTEACVN